MSDSINLNESRFKVSDISYIGKMDRNINQAHNPAVVTHFFVVVVGGQKVEIKNQNKEKLEADRAILVKAFEDKNGTEVLRK